MTIPKNNHFFPVFIRCPLLHLPLSYLFLISLAIFRL
uniref:Uncharacterized protein n=1 Tax=Siphoviridae sp. ctquf9 TaxID=2826470 RepID=A0A8S5M480_9CAUD|nr:MAG TPA: hypothetical protein [Siphoviridae sp. ctquf9]